MIVFHDYKEVLREYIGYSHVYSLEQVIDLYTNLPKTVDIDRWFPTCIAFSKLGKRLDLEYVQIISDTGFLSNTDFSHISDDRVNSLFAALVRAYFRTEEDILVDVLSLHPSQVHSQAPYRFITGYADKLAIADLFVHTEPLCDKLLQDDYKEIAEVILSGLSANEQGLLSREPFSFAMLNAGEVAQELQYIVTAQVKAQVSYNTVAGIQLSYLLDSI